MSTVIYLGTGASYVVYLGGAQGLPGPSGSTSAFNPVLYNATGVGGGLASPAGAPLTPAVGSDAIVDVTFGAVGLNMPILANGQWVRFKMAKGPLNTNPFTINPQSSQPLEEFFPIGTPGVYTTSAQVCNVAGMLGSALVFMLDPLGNAESR